MVFCETQNLVKSKSMKLNLRYLSQSVNLKIRETQNPSSPKSRRFKIVEVYFPVSLKSVKLKIWENQNQGNSKPQPQVFMAVCESQNPGSPKSGQPKIQEV